MEEWNKSKRRKPLILMGARQVGKTWLMDEFAHKYYPNDTVRVNLMKNERLRTKFETIDLDPKTVTEVISIETGRLIEPGKTLLVIDEIQESHTPSLRSSSSAKTCRSLRCWRLDRSSDWL